MIMKSQELLRMEAIEKSLIKHLYSSLEDVIEIISILHGDGDRCPSILISFIYSLLSSGVVNKGDIKMIIDNIERGNKFRDNDIRYIRECIGL